MSNKNVICGIKLTHDGTIALIDDDQLIFSIEMEKLNNNPRFSRIKDLSIIPEVLKEFGYDIRDIDHFVVDGWGGLKQTSLRVDNQNESIDLLVAPYHENSLEENVLIGMRATGLKINELEFEYSSYMHVTGHILSAYCTSPFSLRNESSFILVWDGGMFPRLYYFDCLTHQVRNLDSLFKLTGNIYAIFSRGFQPFDREKTDKNGGLSVAGKVMAYIALGTVCYDLLDFFGDIYKDQIEKTVAFSNISRRVEIYSVIGFSKQEAMLKTLDPRRFLKLVKESSIIKDYKSADILRTFHFFLEDLLLKHLSERINQFRGIKKNLCIAGGCALNIKWNSAIRNSQLFDEVWIPPFANDTGSAIGMACCLMLENVNLKSLNWSVYKGPHLIQKKPARGWRERDCRIKELAQLLHETGEPVVFLNGRAELGPRALGNRSILASATSLKMKEILNQIKGRESYRPIAPICLENKASEIFEPGSKDPYMLFDHAVRKNWRDRIPAICHLDGTARLETINCDENREISDLLIEYEKLTGIPLLCNTSANDKGCGFFPDIYSATMWSQVNYIWSNNILYEKDDKVRFEEIL